MRHRVPAIAIHGFLDGRDSPPTLGAEVVRTLLQDMRRIAGIRVDIATLTGRYYGMDRDRRWERTQLAYDAMVHGVGTPVEHPVLAVQAAYQRGETDEFIQPLVHQRNGAPVADDAGRRRGALLQLPQRPDAPDRGRAGGAEASKGSTSATGPGSPASR